MKESLLNATKEERVEMSIKLHTKLSELLAHQKGMDNPNINLKTKGKEKNK